MIGNDDQERLFSVKEAAELLNVSIRAIKACARQGRIRFVKLRRQVFFRSEDLWAFSNGYLMNPFIKIGG